MGIEGYNIAYNGKDIYVLDHFASIANENRGEEYFSDTYYEILVKNEDRPLDLAKYNYNQLCFTFDNLRGYTTKLVFGDNNLVSLGLNSLLEIYYPNIKKLLLSTKKADYEKGIILLFGGLYDGGHTGMLSKNPPNYSFLEELAKDSNYKDLVNKFLNIENNKMEKRKTFFAAKASAFDDSFASGRPFYYKYNKDYKTAYIGFDTFVIDNSSWDEYYKGNKAKLEHLESELETNDTFAFVRKSLYQAKADGAINVVFDLTTNGGGSNDALHGVFGLINGAKSTYYENNIIDGTRNVKNYSIDINLDGKFDDEDIKEANNFKFNVVALTSSLAFSCGNLLPAMMKEKGLKIIGEKSGGGSCAVIREETVDGFIYLRSGYLCLCDSFGNNIDSGIDVDLNLVEFQNNTADYSKFFDYKTIANYINTTIKK